MNLLRHLFQPKMLLPAIAVVAAGLIGFGLVNQSPASAASCDQDNDIIYCGYTNPADLATKMQASPELQTIYNHAFTGGYGIGDTNNWKANAKQATVYKDGRVVLADGTVVATNARSLGREKFNDGRQAITIGGKTYYQGTTQNNFAANSIPAYAVLNDDNSLKFAALTECGNPVWGTSASYKCTMLNQKKVNDTTYEYTTTINNTNSTLTKLVYDFGDGNTQTVTSNFTAPVSHTYAPGNYTAKVTAHFSVNGQTKTDTRAECTKPVTVSEAPKVTFMCKSLAAALVPDSRTKYAFTIKGESVNTSLQTGAITFGDQQSASDLKPSAENTITVQHEYAQPGTYKASATLTYEAGTTTEPCEVTITVAQPPATPPTTPQVLPATGPIEIAASALGVGSAVGATMYYRSSRRNLIAEILKKR